MRPAEAVERDVGRLLGGVGLRGGVARELVDQVH